MENWVQTTPDLDFLEENESIDIRPSDYQQEKPIKIHNYFQSSKQSQIESPLNNNLAQPYFTELKQVNQPVNDDFGFAQPYFTKMN